MSSVRGTSSNVKAYTGFLQDVSAGGVSLTNFDTVCHNTATGSVRVANLTASPNVSYKSNIYSEYLKSENILGDDSPCMQPVITDNCEEDGNVKVNEGDMHLLMEQVNRAHDMVQKCINEYIRTKNSIRVLEKCRVDLEEKLSNIATALTGVETLTGTSVRVDAVKELVQPAVASLNALTTSRLMEMKKQEREIKKLNGLIALLGNPPNYEKIIYQDGYAL